MSTMVQPVEQVKARSTVHGTARLVTALLALGAVVLAIDGLAGSHTSRAEFVGMVLAIVWAVAAVVVAARQAGRLAPHLAFLALEAAAIGVVSSTGAESELVVLAALLVGTAGHLAVAVPDGVLGSAVARLLAGSCYVTAALGAAAGLADPPAAPDAFVVAALVVLGLGAAGYARRCRVASPLDRARLQWMGWGVVVAAVVASGVALLEVLLSWPRDPGAVALAGTAVLPAAFVASTFRRALGVVERVLVQTIVIGGLVGIVGIAYVLVVIGLGRAPRGDERSILRLSMLAAALAAVGALPARDRIEQWANERVYGERHSPDEALRTFGGRMSRSVPMDELLLQLAESLRKTMSLRAAEVWTGVGGVLDRAVAVPDRGPARIQLGTEELAVASRAHVQGNAWVQVWMPALLDDRADHQVRVAVIAHLGELLGLIVTERRVDDPAFTDDEDRALTELARQVGLALHNVRLDSALQASLDELEARNAELQASRLRIVTAADESRRRIERNLHDGAQQHLVALAVKVGMLKQLFATDPETAAAMADELRGDVQETLTELRELAHGIYPPLLRDRGLSEALRTAANRAVLPTEVDAADVGRYPSEVEAAIYFCCLEAVQNAGKHAGEGSRVTVSVRSTADVLVFEIADDGAGFDAASGRGAGHGFENMRDRVGAVGGSLVVESSVGGGTRVRGTVPVGPAS